MQQNTSQCTAIDIHNLCFSYDKNSSTNILEIERWQVNAGERVFVHGPSGSGKSTLLNLLAGVLKPQRGEISVCGQALHSMSGRQRDGFRARHVGLVFQQFNLIPYLTVRDNIQLVRYHGHTSSKLDDAIITLFDGLQLDPTLMDRRADALSVGQQQRLAIARALINQPELLIVDEPTSALDMAARDSFMQLLMALPGADDRTLVFVSHDPGLADYFSVKVEMQQLSKHKELADAV